MLISYIRTVILYLILILAIRLMGKRQVGQMEPAEFVVTMLVANLAAVPMQDGGIPLMAGVVPILTVLGLELVLATASLGSIWVRRVLCGKPVILIENGQINQAALRATRVTMDELTGHLREKDVLSLQSVQYAILETNGNLSVFPWPKEMPASAKDAGVKAKGQYLPVTIIADGQLYEDNLAVSGHDRKWVQRILDEHRTSLKQTWLLTVDEKGHILWLPKEDKK